MENGETQLIMDFGQEVKPLRFWPAQKDFPLNLKEHSRSSETVVKDDLKNTSHFTIITGFTSLSYLIDTFGNEDYENLQKIKIVLGFEPISRGRRAYDTKSLDIIIKEYWLRQNLSIILGGSIINLIEKIKAQKIEFKFKNRLHAKIYVGENSAMLGSSNFSLNGLKNQSEANIRLTKVSYPKEYSDIKSIADNFYNEAQPYSKIIDLLKALIQQVTWEEALARAIAEVIEGDWLNDYKELYEKLEKTNLWPTQWSGLTQAMNILQDNGNVLIADPTGSGKTKLCTSLVLTLQHWLWQNGRHFKDYSVIVCPPLVMNKWGKEFRELSNSSNNQVSMGILSVSNSRNKDVAIEELKNANILAIDEAHNYLNIETARSKTVRLNNADYKILITATPISKKADDLLRLVQLLDLDNLDDENFKLYQEVLKHPQLQNEVNLRMFKKFISKFTVRRTKMDINKLIEKEPNSYTNNLGSVCKFPKQIPIYYPTNETIGDKEIVEKINSLAKKLKGITYLKKLKKPSYELHNDNIQEYIDNRFNSSRALSIYGVRARLRSSHVALYEHIYGTNETLNKFNFTSSKKNNKARIQNLQSLIQENKKPRIDVIFEGHEIPNWFTSKENFIQTCANEISIYKEIAKEVLKLSGEREKGKVELLVNNLGEHNKIVAFDSTVITLDYFDSILKRDYPHIKVLLATGSSRDGSAQVLKKFQLTSLNDENIIALCSDKMSEGVDLQRASAVVLLDMPSVLRIVEQRLGRVDRLDSYFDEISTFWPDDSIEYSLKGDARLIEINKFVEGTIGSNVNIPDELNHRHFQKIDNIRDMANELTEYIEKDNSWQEINNSFQPIIDLKEGVNPIIKEKLYDQFKGVVAAVKTRVSFLESKTEWCFFAIRGGERKTPKWFFIEKKGSDYLNYTDFPEICEKLREHLIGVVDTKKWNDIYLKKFVRILKEKEIDLLPAKKKRALLVAEELLKIKIRAHKTDLRVKNVMKLLLKLLQSSSQSIDYETYSELWIKVLQPHLENKREQNKMKRKVFNLNNLLNKSIHPNIQFNYEELKLILDSCPFSENINSKIAACIIGVPRN